MHHANDSNKQPAIFKMSYLKVEGNSLKSQEIPS